MLRRVGLRPEGPVPWGTPALTHAPGVYVVELPSALEVAPIAPSAVKAWIRKVPTIRVDGSPATDAALAARLAAFWMPSATVVYIGQASGPVQARVADYYRTPLGDRAPHAGGHWIKTLSCLNDCVVWSAATDDYDDAEREVLDDFSRTVPAAERRALHDPFLVLPFANLRDGTRAGQSARHPRIQADVAARERWQANVLPEPLDRRLVPGRSPRYDGLTMGWSDGRDAISMSFPTSLSSSR